MGESWAHDSAAPEQKVDNAPAALPPPGLAGHVMQLQGLVGNCAVSRALGNAPRRELQRKVDVYPADLGGVGTVGKRSYIKIKETLAAYHKTRDPADEAELLARMRGLINAWKAEALTSPNPAMAQRLGRLLLLEAAIAAELPSLPQAQAVYQQRHQAYEQDLKTSLGARGNQPRPFTRLTTMDVQSFAAQAPATKHQKRAKWAREQYGLDEAEILAIRIYSLGAFGYINPAYAPADVKSDVKTGAVKEDWLKWMKGGMKDADPAATDPKAAEIAAAAAEGMRHGKVFEEALAKLPLWKGTAYRGVKLEKKVFKAKYLDSGGTLVAETFWSTSKTRTKPETEFAVPKPGRPVSVLLKLKLRTGRKIKRLSLLKGEDEVTVMPGTRFRITSLGPAEAVHPKRMAVKLDDAEFWDGTAEELPPGGG
jgi:hypothetical protein